MYSLKNHLQSLISPILRTQKLPTGFSKQQTVDQCSTRKTGEGHFLFALEKQALCVKLKGGCVSIYKHFRNDKQMI